MKVTFPLTITTPGGTINTPFGPTQVADRSATFMAEVDSTDIAPLFPPSSGSTPSASGSSSAPSSAPSHLTAVQLRASYTDAELLAAIESPNSPTAPTAPTAPASPTAV